MVNKEGNDNDVDVFLDMLSDAFSHFPDADDDGGSEKNNKKIASAKRVPRIPYSSITPEDFARIYSSTNTPILLGDAPCAPMHLNIDYWRQNHSSALVPLDLSTPSEKVVKLGDFLKFEGDLRTGYLRSLHTFEWFPTENEAITFPDVFGTNHLREGPLRDSGVLPAAWARWFELFISTKDSPGFPFLHQDMCSTHAFSFQVQGIKRFYMFHPSDSEFLYTYGHTGTRSAIPHRDIVTDTVDLNAFPLYEKADMYIADLRPGDVFFCPSDWWHSTNVVSAEPSVTLGGNFVDDSNRAAFESKWREYVSMQTLVQGGACRIEHGGKRLPTTASRDAAHEGTPTGDQ